MTGGGEGACGTWGSDGTGDVCGRAGTVTAGTVTVVGSGVGGGGGVLKEAAGASARWTESSTVCLGGAGPAGAAGVAGSVRFRAGRGANRVLSAVPTSRRPGLPGVVTGGWKVGCVPQSGPFASWTTVGAVIGERPTWVPNGRGGRPTASQIA